MSLSLSTRTRRTATVTATAVLLLGATLAGPAAAERTVVDGTDESATIVRYAGADRYETSADFAAEGVGAARAAVVTTGRDFPDALAGSYLAGNAVGPVLLTEPTALPAATRRAIEDLAAADSFRGTVYVLGGDAAISSDVLDAIGLVDGVDDVVRIAGADRYATAARIARTMPGAPVATDAEAAEQVGEVDGQRTAIVATGTDFPDALVAGVASRFAGLPVLLVRPDEVPEVTADTLRALGIERVVVAGGTAAVSQAVEDVLDADHDVVRVAGADRFETAVAFAEYLEDTLGLDSDGRVGLALGQDFPDALSMAPFAGGPGEFPILLTARDALPRATRDALADRADDDAVLYVAGGGAAVSDAVATTAADVAKPDLAPPDVSPLAATADGEAGSLRDAIDKANADADTTIIGLEAGATYTLAVDGDRDEANASGDLDITSDVVIRGNGATIDADGLDRVLEILGDGVEVELDDVTVTGGATEDAADANGFGGGIRVADGATLRMDGGAITGNTASKAGGGLENAGSTVELDDVDFSGNSVTGGDVADAANGGAMHTTGPTDVEGGVVADNTAALEGGGFWVGGGATLSVDGTELYRNTASGDEADQGGGALFNIGSTLRVRNTTVGAEGEGNVADGASGSGGGILTVGGTLEVAGGSIDANSASRAGGGIEGGVLSADGEDDQPATVTLDGVDLHDNTTGPNPGNGGAMHLTGLSSADVSWGRVTDNTAANEGGGFWVGGGRLEVDGTTFLSNRADGVTDTDAPQFGGGGALFVVGGELDVHDATIGGLGDGEGNAATGANGSGGGILNDGGTLTVRDTVIAGNTANRAGGGIEVARDNGVDDGDDSTTSDAEVEATLTDVVLRGNSVQASPMPGNGGGMHVGGGDSVVRGGTVVDNAAREGGGLWNGGGTMSVTSTSFLGNDANGGVADDPATDTTDETVLTGGGAMFVVGGTLEVTGAVVGGTDDGEANTASGVNGNGGGIMALDATLAVDRSSLVGNTANRAGGGIELNGTPDGAGGFTVAATVDRSRFEANVVGDAPGNGGGIHVTGGGDLDVTDSALLRNVAANEGGAIWGLGTTDVVGTTIWANASAEGGGLFNQGGTMNVVNSTVSDNVDDDPADGDDPNGTQVVNGPGGSRVVLQYTTVLESDTSTPGLSIVDLNSTDAGSGVTVGNAAVDGDCGGPGPVVDVGGTVAADASCLDGGAAVADLGLGALADNGSDVMAGAPAQQAVVRTHAPTGGSSPVVDAAGGPGTDTVALAPDGITFDVDVDQRRAPRGVGADGTSTAPNDAGAVEFASTPPDAG